MLKRQYLRSSVLSEKQADLSGTLVDVFGNISLVQTFAAHKQEYTHYRRFMDSAVVAENAERRISLFNKFQQGGSLILLSAALVMASIILFTKGMITIGDFVIVGATIQAFVGIVFSFGEIVIRGVRQYGEMKNALESLETTLPHIKQGNATLTLSQPGISFDDVTFSYPSNDKKVLDRFKLTIQPGQKVGLIGSSGAGKSTVVKLLLRSYDVASGSIAISGSDVSHVSLDSVRHAIAFVPQDTSLFHRTLYENILYAKPDATRDQVLAASMAAHAHDFIEQYPNGYDTLVGERGVKLSGGQRQRIALARAMLKNAPILVLDEATSALDSESEEVVQAGLNELFKGRTVLAIAHRLSTLRSMDRIIVMNEGKIIEDGSPTELLAKEGSHFKHMWEHQKKGFI